MEFDPPVGIVANARSHGTEGELVVEPDDVDGALERSLGSEDSFVVDALVED
jgi:benzoylformate decarboxylase